MDKRREEVSPIYDPTESTYIIYVVYVCDVMIVTTRDHWGWRGHRGDGDGGPTQDHPPQIAAISHQAALISPAN